MRIFWRTALAVTVGMISFATPAFAQSSAEAYADASTALDKGDCPRAVQSLEKYKAMVGSKLEAHPEALAKINKQIAACKAAMAKNPWSMTGAKAFVNMAASIQ